MDEKERVEIYTNLMRDAAGILSRYNDAMLQELVRYYSEVAEARYTPDADGKLMDLALRLACCTVMTEFEARQAKRRETSERT